MVQHVGDLELATSRHVEGLDDGKRAGPQEVHTDRDQVALGMERLLLEVDDVAGRAQLGDTESLGVRNPVEHGSGVPGTSLELGSDVCQSRPSQDVVAEYDTKR